MGTLEMILLSAGAVIFIISFCIPIKQEKLKEETRNLAAEEVKSLVAGELNAVQGKLAELSEEEIKQQIAKSERTMERISNEKIMAVNEYSDTVLEEIHKNHEEVVFLYDMLKNKNTSLTESYEKADKDLQELLQQVKDSELTVRENLGELEKKRQEIEELRTEIMLWEPPVQTVSVQTAEIPAVLAEEEPQQEPEKAFRPFTPEKVEAQPKKAQVKTAQAAPPREMPPEAVQEQVPEEEESKEVMLLLSNMPEKDAGGNSNERILKLHEMGKSNMAIARELGLGLGEVKLVIDLYEGTH